MHAVNYGYTVCLQLSNVDDNISMLTSHHLIWTLQFIYFLNLQFEIKIHLMCFELLVNIKAKPTSRLQPYNPTTLQHSLNVTCKG